MWAFFKTLFNILRNISLIIVLAVVGCFAWIWTDEELKQEFVSIFNEETVLAEKIEQKEVEPSDNQLIQIKNEKIDEADEKINAFNEDEETTNSSEISIISIREINGDLRYVNLAEIIYFRKYGQDEYLTTTTNEKVRTDISLNNVFQALQEFKSHFFFKTKNNIINCKMIKRISSENISEDGNNYIHKVEMKNGDIISVNKNKIKDLKDMMKKIARQIK